MPSSRINRRTFAKHAALLAGSAAMGGLLPAPARAGEPISVTQWRVTMHGFPFAVAMKKGFFSDAGVDVSNILPSKGGITTMRNILAEGLPYAEAALSALVAAAKMNTSLNNKGDDFVIVNTSVNSIGDAVWLALPSSPIKSIKDLEGKRVGYTNPKSATEMLLILSLEKAKVNLNQVTRVPTGGYLGGIKALESGTVDAVPAMEPLWANFRSKFRPVFYPRDWLPAMTQTVGVTTSNFVESHAKKLRSLIAARRRAVQLIYDSPDKVVPICAETYELSPAVAAAVLENLVKLRYWSEGSFDIDAMNEMVKGLRVVGEIDQGVDWSKLIDQRFLPNELRNTNTI